MVLELVLGLLLTQFWTPISLNKFIDFADVLVTLELLKRIILKNKYSLWFVWLFHLEGDCFLGFGVKSRVYNAEGALTQLLKQPEPILNEHFCCIIVEIYLIISVSDTVFLS